MINATNPRLVFLFKSAARAASAVVMVFGSVVLLGWALRITALNSVRPALSTALALILAGVSLWVLASEEPDHRSGTARGAAQACAVTVALVGCVSLGEYLSGWDLGIDQPLFQEPEGETRAFAPGRTSLMAALSLLLLGLALALAETRRGLRVAQSLALMVACIGLLNLGWYFYSAEFPRVRVSDIQMAGSAAAALVLLSAGVLFARPESGLMAVVTSDSQGGLVRRRLLPLALTIPYCLGWFRLVGERGGFYGVEFGAAVTATLGTAVTSLIILWIAGALDRTDLARRQSQQALRENEATFRELFDKAPVGYYELDADGRMVRINLTGLAMAGYTAEEMLGRYGWEFVLERETARESIAAKLAGIEPPGSLERTLVRKDGSLVPVLVEERLLTDAESRVTGLRRIIQDISDLKRAEREREQLLTLERAARKEAEEAQTRLAFLSQASELLASSLDYSDTLARVARLAVPFLADLCSVDLVEEDESIRDLAAAMADPAEEAWAHELKRRYPIDPKAPYGPASVLRTGQSEIYSETSDALAVAIAHNAEHLEILRASRITSAMVVPLQARGRTLGAITFLLREDDRRYGPIDLELAENLARRAALAVDNARLFRESRRAQESRDRALADLRVREGQQSALAALSQRALSGIDLSSLMHEAAALTTWTLGVEYSGIFELLPDGRLLLRAGAGWSEGRVGRATLEATAGSLAAYIFRCGKPVIVEDAPKESRFEMPPLLKDHAAVSSVSVAIGGEGRPFGSLSVGTSTMRKFSEDDAHFVQGVADVLAQAIGRNRAEAQARYQARLLANVNDAIIATDEQHILTAWNRAAEKMYGWKAEEVLGWPAQGVIRSEFNEVQQAEALRALSENGHYRAEVIEYRRDGRPVYVESNTISLHSEDGATTGYVTVNRDVSRRTQAEDALRQSAERLRALSRRLMEVQEAQRRTFACALHDEIGQALTALKINLESMQRTCTQAALLPNLQDSTAIVQQTIQQVRNLSLDLRPAMLDDLGLVPALRWYLDRQAQRTGLAISFDCEGVGMRPSPEIETVCFRVAQEALTNVLRHAQARQVRVELRQHGPELQLIIRDDGKGFDVNAALERSRRGESLGLLGMQEHISLAGGQLEIESVPDRGAEIRAKVPMS